MNGRKAKALRRAQAERDRRVAPISMAEALGRMGLGAPPEGWWEVAPGDEMPDDVAARAAEVWAEGGRVMTDGSTWRLVTPVAWGGRWPEG